MLALLVFLAPMTALRVPGPLSPRNANYKIEASLDAVKKSVKGHERITWRNDAAVPARELVLHLYMNAVRNDQSAFDKESQGHDRGNPSHGWGAIDVTRITVAGRPASLKVDHTL